MEKVIWSAKTMQEQEMSKKTSFHKGKERTVFEKTIHDSFVIRPMMERIGDVIRYYISKKPRLITTLLFPDKDANDTQQRAYRMNYSNFIRIMAEMIQKYGVL